MSTNENLQAAFAGESQANRKYLAFAKKAEKDGYPQVAKLFRSAAAAETIHAHAHFRVLGGIGGTESNLESAIEGEGYEFRTMYPEFIEQAQKESNEAALKTFQNANEVEKIHHQLYTEALDAVKNGQDLPGQDIYVCQVCGNTVKGSAPDQCEICGVTSEKFNLIS